MSIGECRSCHAPVRWCTNEKTNKPAPLDITPVEDGNCVISATLHDAQGGPVYRVLSKSERAVGGVGSRYKNHFATCPNRQEYKR